MATPPEDLLADSGALLRICGERRPHGTYGVVELESVHGTLRLVEHAWWLTNQRGYRDAFQIRLLDPNDRSDVTRQFEVAASALHLRSVNG